jgi:hypothetical protein
MHYRGAGHSASIRCMIRSAKITAAMIECRAGDERVLSKLGSTLRVPVYAQCEGA